MARIKVVEYEESEGRLKEIYNDILARRKVISNVYKVQSLRPESLQQHLDLYMEIMFSKSSISRAEREMIATVVSAANGCSYCQTHHGDALNQYWKDEKRVEALKINLHEAGLSERELRMATFAASLTREPQIHEKNDTLEQLKDVGIDDSGILDIILVVSYFNFVNRMVLATGAEIE